MKGDFTVGGRKGTITICGSMDFIPQMKAWRALLIREGYAVFVPHLINHRASHKPLHSIGRLKASEARIHFEKIRKSDAILVLNYEKGGIENYIGGAAFGEITVAFLLRKRIFLLNPIPLNLPYTEELVAWGVDRWTGPTIQEMKKAA